MERQKGGLSRRRRLAKSEIIIHRSSNGSISRDVNGNEKRNTKLKQISAEKKNFNTIDNLLFHLSCSSQTLTGILEQRDEGDELNCDQSMSDDIVILEF